MLDKLLKMSQTDVVRNRKGFTLIELMVVITIIAILATIALFGIGKAQAAARDAQRQQIMNGIRIALERYYGDMQFYPMPGVAASRWSQLMSTSLDAQGIPVGVGSYLGTIPFDPCNGRTNIPADGVMLWCQPTAYLYTPVRADETDCSGTYRCTKYTLTLTKESGGTSIFSSPQ